MARPRLDDDYDSVQFSVRLTVHQAARVRELQRVFKRNDGTLARTSWVLRLLIETGLAALDAQAGAEPAR